MDTFCYVLYYLNIDTTESVHFAFSYRANSTYLFVDNVGTYYSSSW